MQQFLDKHSRAVLAFPSPLRLISSSGHANAVPLFPGGRRLCLRRPPRYALSLRLATPTPSGFSRADVAFVCAALPATPYSSVRPRQRSPTFPGRTSPLLAFPSPLRLIPSLATPTPSGFSRADVAFVCAALPATPYSSVRPRQRDPDFPGRTPPLLASPYPLRLVSPSDHANTTGNFPGGRRLCLRRPPRCALFPGFPNNHTSIQESSNNYCYFWRASNGLTPRSRYSCSCFIRTSPCAGAFPGSR